MRMKFCVDVVSIRRRGAANRVIAQCMRIAVAASIRRGVANRFMATFIALGDPLGAFAREIASVGDMVAETCDIDVVVREFGARTDERHPIER